MGDSQAGGGHSFMAEIRKMMYVCGDCVQPSVESATMVEDITQQQIVQVAVKAMECARQRCDGPGTEVVITVEDILFLLRKDKSKLKRVLYQIDFRAQARRTSTTDTVNTCNVGGDGARGRPCLSLDSDSLTDLFGRDFYSAEEALQLQQDKLQRHDSRTRGMDSAEYMNYVECRQMSFNKNMGNFRKWLNLESAIGQKPAQSVMEVLGYLAYDTVRELVELSLLVKQDIARSHQRIISSHHLILPSSQPPPSSPSHPSPPQSPPGSANQPTSPSDGVSQEEGSGAATQTRNSRGRKRKRSVPETGGILRHPDSASEHPQGGSQSSQNVQETDRSERGIQPSHIREALRRLDMPSGPLLPLATYYCRPSFTQKTICL